MTVQVKLHVESINLMRSEVTGLQYYDYARSAKEIEVGDRLELQRDRANEFDKMAVAVYYNGDKIGFIASENNKLAATLLGHEIPLEAYVTEHDHKASIFKGSKRLMVAIYMPYTFVVED